VSVWGFINPTAPQTYYADVDSDGFGDLNSTVIACSAPQGYTTNNTDCDDNNTLINPNTIWYVDADQDGYGDPNNFTTSCLTPPGTVLNGDDCDDTNAQLALVAMYYVDADGDGFGDDATGVEQCSQPANTVTVGGDCDDLNDQSYPGAVEICDNEDNNCDGNSDEGLPLITYYEDLDNDDFGSANTLESCDSLGAGYSLTTGDCDDANDQVYPGATEVIDNGIDENCDGVDNYLGLVSMDNWIIELLPNPSTGSFQINCGLAIFDVVVTDITGKVLYTQNDQHVENMISTQPWAPATYFVTVRYNGQSKVERLQVR
jgi:hypothetical protein